MVSEEYIEILNDIMQTACDEGYSDITQYTNDMEEVCNKLKEIQSLKQQLAEANEVMKEADEYIEEDGAVSIQYMYEALVAYKEKWGLE